MANSEILSNGEKLRIRMEEVYRNEVKRSLEHATDKKSVSEKTWNILNSTFGIWFLSSCVIGLITFFYNQSQKKEQQKLEAIRSKEQKESEKRQNEIEHARRNASMVTVLLPYLASQEEKQWRLAAEVTNYLRVKGELPGELESALTGIVRSVDTTKASPGHQAKVNTVAAVIDGKYGSAQGNDTGFISLPPRVYIHITGEEQRDLAKSVQKQLQVENFIVPGIQNLPRIGAFIPNKTEVRYYLDKEKEEAIRIIAILKELNLGLQIMDVPQKVAGEARPRHYEIWFSKR